MLPEFFGGKIGGKRFLILVVKSKHSFLNHKLCLKQWCEDVNSSQADVKFDFVYVDQERFDSLTGETRGSGNQLTNFASLLKNFREYKGD